MATATSSAERSYPKGFASFNDINGDVSHDMHVKMSKKIAQLTKVIYALNTRNDEHEAAVELLKKEHNSEIERILAKNKEKLSQYQSAVGQDAEYRKQIRTLESCIKEHESEQGKLLFELSESRKHFSEKESELITLYDQKMSNLISQLTSVKSSYEETLSQIQALSSKTEAAKHAALQEQKLKHDQRIQEIMKNQKELENSISSASQQVHEKYIKQIDELQKQLDISQNEISKCNSDYENKLNKCQQLHEKELEALKNQMESGKSEQLEKLQRLYDDVKKENYALQSEIKRQRDDLLTKIAHSEELVETLQRKLKDIGHSDSEKDNRIDQLTKELNSVCEDLKVSQGALRSANIEIQALTEKSNNQTKDIINKSELIGELQATVLQHESALSKLKDELSKLSTQTELLQRENTELLRGSELKSNQTDKRIENLDKALKVALEDNKNLKKQMDLELSKLTKDYESKEKLLNEKHEKERKVALKKYDDELKRIGNNHTGEVKLLNQENESKLEVIKNQSDKDRKVLEREFSKVRKDLESKVKSKDSRICELESFLKEKESGLGSASESLGHLEAEKSRLEKEIEVLNRRLKSDQSDLQRVRAEYEKLRVIHDQKLLEAKKEMSQKLSELSAELDKKWADTLRRETAKLRQEYDMQSKADSQAGLQAFKKMKEKEIEELKDSFYAKEAALKNEVSLLKERLAALELESSSSSEEIKSSYENEIAKLKSELHELQNKKTKEIDILKYENEKDIEEVRSVLNKQILEIQAVNTKREQEAVKKAQLSHRAEIERIRLEVQKKTQQDMDELVNKLEREREEIRSELVARFASELEGHAGSHSQQTQALEFSLKELREELEAKERSFSQRYEQLRVENLEKDRGLNKLTQNLEESKSEISCLRRELDIKGKEILQARSEFTSQIKHKEEILSIKYEAQLMKVKEESEVERKRVITEFSKAQELLKMKIMEYKKRLQDSEERFSLREPRDEDVREIESLKKAVHDREAEVKRLIEDMRYYKNELVNRETNYNKVFNPSSPQVGIINPLAPKKKKSGSVSEPLGSSHKASGGKVHARLEPLPGSPLHDEPLAHAKPLPPPHGVMQSPSAKKFL